MPALTVEVSDLDPFMPGIEPIKAQAMIDDAMAIATRVAPCIITAEFAYSAAARAVIRGAILRWHDSGTGALQSQNAGPFGQTLDTRQTRKGMFWPSEITQLQDLCGVNRAAGGAFSIDTTPIGVGLIHADTCALNFGATYCSCGAVLTGNVPLYGV